MNSSTEDDLACTDELKVYEDEGEEEEQAKSSENLTEDKVGLVIESEEQVPRLFDLFRRNGSSLLKMPWPTDPRFASYFLPGYPAAFAAVMAAMRGSTSPVCSSPTCGVGDYSPGASGGFLNGLVSSSVASPGAVATLSSTPSFYPSSWESQSVAVTTTATSAFNSPAITDGLIDVAGGSDAQPVSQMPSLLSSPFNPFVSLYHNPLQRFCATATTGAASPAPRTHASPSKSTPGRPSFCEDVKPTKFECWNGELSKCPITRSEACNEFAPNPATASTRVTGGATTSASSLYAAVMAAAVASWSDHSVPTPTSMPLATPNVVPRTGELPPPAGLETNSGKLSNGCFDLTASRMKPLNGANPSYSPSMFAAAAAAHMHFLSAAAAAASFTGGLNSCQSMAKSSRPRDWEDERMSARTPMPYNVKRNTNETWRGRRRLTPTSTDISRQNVRKPTSDLDPTTPSPTDEALIESDDCRLFSRLTKTHIKKPLNAFMLFMKEMRPRVQEECTLKESAAINQILGKKWHELSRSEQTKYYEMARQEKELHQRLHPGWSARDNYAYNVQHRRRRNRRSRRACHMQSRFISKLNTCDSSKSVSISRRRSSSFHGKWRIAENSPKDLVRPHSSNGMETPQIKPTASPSSPKSPVKNGVCEQLQLPSPVSPTTSITFASSAPRLASTSTNHALAAVPGYSEFGQHYNTGPDQSAKQLTTQRSCCYSSVYGTTQATQVIRAHPNNYWGYEGPTSQSVNPRNPYLTVTALNKDSAAAVAAVAAMAAGELSGSGMKKCRARFGLEHQNLWCKPCRRKKKCVRFISENETNDHLPHHHHSHSAAASSRHHHLLQNTHLCDAFIGHLGCRGTAMEDAIAYGHGRPYTDDKGTPSTTSHRRHSFMAGDVPPLGGEVVGTTLSPFNPFHRQSAKQLTTPLFTPISSNAIFSPATCNTSSATLNHRLHESVEEFPRAPHSSFTRNSTTIYSDAFWWSSSSPPSTLCRSSDNLRNQPPSRFITPSMISSSNYTQGDVKSPRRISGEIQGLNTILSHTYTTPPAIQKPDNSPFKEQGTFFNTSSKSFDSAISPPIFTVNSTVGQHLRRECPALGFGVADVMGVRLDEEVSRKQPFKTAPVGNANSSLCPLHSSPGRN